MPIEAGPHTLGPHNATLSVETKRKGAAAKAGHDLVINATSLGLKPNDPLPIDAGRLGPATAVAEIIMEPETTALLVAAQERGCRIFYGRPMLACQVDLIADFLRVPKKGGASS